MIELIPWECDFFGRKIARLEVALPLPDVEEYCKREHIELVQACVASDDREAIASLEKQGFQLVDEKLTMVGDVTAAEKNNHIRISTEADIPKLLAVGHHCFTGVSRYNWQAFFSDAQIDAFYDTWLENGVRGKHDDFCLHYQEGNDIAGFATVKVRGHDAYIGIIAVGEKHRGRGIGDALVRAVMGYAQDKKLTTVSSVTQGKNTRTQNLYRKHGMQVRNRESWYYKMYPSVIPAQSGIQ